MSERVIPGLTGPNASKASSKRSRPKSTKQPGSGPNASTAKDAPADASTTQPHNGPHKAAGLTLNPDALLVPQDALVDLPAKIPASQTVGKRIKAVQKKLVRPRKAWPL